MHRLWLLPPPLPSAPAEREYLAAGSTYYGHYLKNSQSFESRSTREATREKKRVYERTKAALKGAQVALATLSKQTGEVVDPALLVAERDDDPLSSGRGIGKCVYV